MAGKRLRIVVESFHLIIVVVAAVVILISIFIYLFLGLVVHLAYLFLQIILFIRHLRDCSPDCITMRCHLALSHAHTHTLLAL